MRDIYVRQICCSWTFFENLSYQDGGVAGCCLKEILVLIPPSNYVENLHINICHTLHQKFVRMITEMTDYGRRAPYFLHCTDACYQNGQSDLEILVLLN